MHLLPLHNQRWKCLHRVGSLCTCSVQEYLALWLSRQQRCGCYCLPGQSKGGWHPGGVCMVPSCAYFMASCAYSCAYFILSPPVPTSWHPPPQQHALCTASPQHPLHKRLARIPLCPLAAEILDMGFPFTSYTADWSNVIWNVNHIGGVCDTCQHCPFLELRALEYLSFCIAATFQTVWWNMTTLNWD